MYIHTDLCNTNGLSSATTSESSEMLLMLLITDVDFKDNIVTVL